MSRRNVRCKGANQNGQLLKPLSGSAHKGSWSASFLNGYIVRAFIQFMREICRNSFPISASPEGLSIQVKCETGIRCLIDVEIPQRCLRHYYYVAPEEAFDVLVMSDNIWEDAKGLLRQTPATLTKLAGTDRLSVTIAEKSYDSVPCRLYNTENETIAFPTLDKDIRQAINLSLKELSKNSSVLKQRGSSACNYTMSVYQTYLVLSARSTDSIENCRRVIGTIDLPITRMTGQEISKVMDLIADGQIVSNIPDIHPEIYHRYLQERDQDGEEPVDEEPPEPHDEEPPEPHEDAPSEIEDAPSEIEEDEIDDDGGYWISSTFSTTQELIAKANLDPKLVKALSKLSPCDSAVVRVLAVENQPVKLVIEIENLGTISIYMDEIKT